MIKANELRIGNWVEKDKNILKICFMDFEDMAYNEEKYTNEINPIPITPEILEKAGFEKSIETIKGFVWGEKNSDKDFDIRFDGEYAFLQIECCDTGRGIKYLHQLQNLYWCLCEEELEINFT